MIESASQFVGQKRARALLARYIERGRLSGTFLLMGQRGLGKTTLATMLARALCCTGERGDEPLSFCGQCYPCRSIAAGEQPEYVTVRPTGQNISVKQLDEDHDGLRGALYHPNQLSHRVFLIDGAHYLNEESGNRLLKVFEEAPEKTVFLLTTDRPEQLLPTIHSRGQKVTLVPLPAEEIRQALAVRGMEPQAAAEAAQLCGGRIVDALALAVDPQWRQAVRVLGQAILRRTAVPEAAAVCAQFEHAMLWGKEQADHGMEEAELEKLLPKARQNELLRQALISAYDRASWGLLWETRADSGHASQGTGNRELGTGNSGGGFQPPESQQAAGRRQEHARSAPDASLRTPDSSGIINMDDWDDGSQHAGGRRQGTAASGSATRDDSFAPQRQTGERLREPARGPGPLHDPDYMTKLATLRKRISGNVDRDLAQMAFEASL